MSSFLRLQNVVVYVRNQDRSIQFYCNHLGFKLVADAVLPDGRRWVAVAPVEGTAMLGLVAPEPDTPEYSLIGRDTQTVFLAEDVQAKMADWSRKGIAFQTIRQRPNWSGTFAKFQDPDGNSFAIVGFDAATREIEAARQTAAAKAEAERQIAQEWEIARQVQARLFPQAMPQIKGLHYAGLCLQARQVGGDYYDFLALGPGRIGFALGDISGKGIGGALLMANLQANLRSLCANASNEPFALLPVVNQLFHQNTASSSYATLFFAEYCSQQRQLRYVNCGHLPALLLRHDGSIERLESTSTVLGMFPNWECVQAEVAVLPGDLLLLYTDGLCEACNEQDEEFGEERLTAALQQHRELPPPELLTTLVEQVRRFAPREQQDDITLIAAKLCASEE